MKGKRELIMYDANRYDLTRNHVMLLANERGFTRENSMLASVHYLPSTPITVENLIPIIVDFLAPGKFEFIVIGEYKTKDNNVNGRNEDLTSTTHLHFLIKGRYSELKPYIKEWNTNTSYRSNPLFHATPIDGSVEQSLDYLFKELKKSNGIIQPPHGTYFKQKESSENLKSSAVFLDFLGAFWRRYKIALRLNGIAAVNLFNIEVNRAFKLASIGLKQIETEVYFDNQPNSPP